MRKALLIAFVLAAQGLLAQEAPPAQAPAQAAPAPRLGHPLDPADVDILTGKADRANRSTYGAYASPYGYFSYPLNASAFSGSRFAPVSTATQPPFAPLLFGRVGNRPFVVFGRTTPFVPGAFFFRGRRTTVFFPLSAAPGFLVWRR